MITRIQAIALKGRTFSHALSPLNIIAGPNDSGKTAIVDAIRLLLLGSIPGQPKTASGIFALSSASNMNVSGVLTVPGDKGAAISRSWHAKGKSVGAVEQGTSSLPDFPLAMMDAAAYFGASETARTAMVFGLVDLSKMGFAPATLTRELQAAAGVASKILEQAIGKLPPPLSTQDWIDGVLEHLEQEQKTLSAEITRMEKTGQGIASLAQGEAMVDANAIAEKLRQATIRLVDLSQTMGGIEQRLQTGRRRTVLEAERAALERKLAEPAPDTTATEKAIEELEAEIAAIGIPDTTASAAAMTEARIALGDMRGAYQAAERALKECAEKWEKLRASHDCPICGRAFEGTITALEERETNPLRVELKTLETNGTHTRKRYDEAERAHTQRCQAADHRRQLDGKLMELRQQLREQKGAQSRRKELEEYMATATAQLKDEAPPIAELQAKRDETQMAVKTVEAEIVALKQEERKAAAQAADSRRAAQAQQERATKQETRAAVKEMIKVLKEKREELVKAAFGPLLNTANRFTRGILPSALEYDDGEIGRWEGTSWVPVRAFGGAFGAVAYAGIQAALAAQSGLRLVIVDELGRFDDQSLRGFLANTIDAITAGVLEQFIGIDVNPERYRSMEALHLIRTGPK